MKKWIFRGLAVLVALAAGTGAIVLGELGFGRILDFRMLERIPLTTIAGSVGGEAQLKGRVEPSNGVLNAPKTNHPALYYRYLVEEERRDSDGNTSWHTVRDESRATNFFVVDDTDRALVLARHDLSLIDWSVKQKFRREQGDMRYTEWRIDPMDTVTVFGWLETGTIPEIRFSTAGSYVPIVSSFSAASERGDIGVAALVMLWGSVTAMAVACLALVYVLQMHKTTAFLVIITFMTSLLLIHYGARSLESDVAEGFARVESQRARTEERLKEVYRSEGLAFPGWNTPTDPALLGDIREQVDEWRVTSYLVRARYLNQVSRFPENVYAAMSGKSNPPQVTLTPTQQQAADEAMASFQATRVSAFAFLTIPAILITAGVAWFAFRSIRIKRMQENLAVSKTEGVVFGLAEVEGELVPEDYNTMLSGPVSHVGCSWYHYIVKEKRGSGKNTKWVTITDEIKKQPFYCEDEEGRIRVFPGKADVITEHRDSKREGRYRYIETRLEPADKLYILGKARLDKTTGDKLVFGHEDGAPFIIANVPEREVMFRKAFKGFSLLTIGISLLFGAAIWIGGSNGQFSSLDFVLASLIAPLFLLMVVLILMYNDLIFLKQRCERNWSNIQVSLRKRSNLIPRLESVVKEYLAHEEELHTELARLRSSRQDANNVRDLDEYMSQEHQSIARINATIEQYPDLKGVELITDLNRRLIKLENEVALIRAGFNDAVMQYRTRLETFPDNLIASMFRFKPYRSLNFSEAAHHIPNVAL